MYSSFCLYLALQFLVKHCFESYVGQHFFPHQPSSEVIYAFVILTFICHTLHSILGSP